MNRRWFVLLAVAPLALPQGKGKGKAKHDSDPDERFRPEETRVIAEYYRNANLPPGIQKQLRRKGTLPPGLQKKLAPLPPDLERRLPPPPPQCRRVIVGGVALLIADATNVVLDILDLTRH